jgi:hypothetical protein
MAWGQPAGAAGVGQPHGLTIADLVRDLLRIKSALQVLVPVPLSAPWRVAQIRPT